MNEATPGPSVPVSVANGMAVLRAFRSDRAALSNSELVRRTGLSKSMVSRHITTLMELGYVRRVTGGREFVLATRAVGLGQAWIARSELIRTVQPFLQDLADELGVSAALATGVGTDMVYIGYAAGREVATLRLGVGSILPMGRTSIGHAWLWAQPVAARKRLLAQLKRDAGGPAAALELGIEQSFAELERSGVCGVHGAYQHATYGVALPVWVGAGGIPLGLSCGKADLKPDLAAERRRIAPVLREAALQLRLLLAEFEGMP